MLPSDSLPSQHPGDAPPTPVESLSPAQLEFARLLGRLLARLWHDEQQRGRPEVGPALDRQDPMSSSSPPLGGPTPSGHDKFGEIGEKSLD